MNITDMKDFRNRATTYLKSDDPTIVVEYGKVSGLFFPLQNNADIFPEDLRKELLEKLGEYLNKSLEFKSATEEEIIDEFKDFRKNSRRF